MKQKEFGQILLNSLSLLDHRRWESLEKNNKAAELSQQIRTAINTGNTAELEKLTAEVKYFMSPTFTLFERVKRLTQVETDRSWTKESDTVAWKALLSRATTVIHRNDTEELKQITERIIAFLKSRNGHVLAQNLEDALKITRKQR